MLRQINITESLQRGKIRESVLYSLRLSRLTESVITQLCACTHKTNP